MHLRSTIDLADARLYFLPPPFTSALSNSSDIHPFQSNDKEVTSLLLKIELNLIANQEKGSYIRKILSRATECGMLYSVIMLFTFLS